MSLGFKINNIPFELGTELSPETLAEAAFKKAALWRRLLRRPFDGHAVYDLADCEFKGLDESLHIYPCTHSYLNRDRRWRTRVTLFLRKDRLERILLQVIEGQTAAVNFLDRFAQAATTAIGEPCHQERFHTCWQGDGARIEAKLHPDRSNADFEITMQQDVTDSPAQ